MKLTKFNIYDHFRFDESEMGNPRCIAPLIAAALVEGGFSLVSGGLSYMEQEKANNRNIEMINKANTIANQQWGAEFGEKKREFNIESNIKQKSDFENLINNTPIAFRKSFIDIWGGGK